ncbi:MAG TPA: hypothetical protein VKA50_14615 [Gammaproteobacteria bacterium]|nr:hypothetical protein [Gammaproteobacteria bacterium]
MKRGSWQGAALIAACWLALAMPPVRDGLEADMVRHMLVQLPLLLAVGIGLSRVLPVEVHGLGARIGPWNGGGIPGLVLAFGVVLFWMVPRTLDAALDHTAFESAKFLVLPLAGFVLARSWPRLPLIGRGVVYANLLSMSWVLGWAYLVAPQRICTNYRFDQQEQLGLAFLGVGAALAVYLVLHVAVGGARAGGSGRAGRRGQPR